MRLAGNSGMILAASSLRTASDGKSLGIRTSLLRKTCVSAKFSTSRRRKTGRSPPFQRTRRDALSPAGTRSDEQSQTTTCGEVRRNAAAGLTQISSGAAGDVNASRTASLRKRSASRRGPLAATDRIPGSPPFNTAAMIQPLEMLVCRDTAERFVHPETSSSCAVARAATSRRNMSISDRLYPVRRRPARPFPIEAMMLASRRDFATLREHPR